MFSVCRRFTHHLKPYQTRKRCFSKTPNPPMKKLTTLLSVGSCIWGFGLAVSLKRCSKEENTITTRVEVDDEGIPYVGGVVRFLRSVKIAIVISLDYTFSSMGLTEDTSNYDVMMSRIHQRSAKRLLEGCLMNGGTYIKLGQGLVCMNHVLPKEYTETLKQLQDKCLKRKSDEVERLFVQDFGKTPREMYKYFNDEAIAAASLAQVFKATTKDGQDVAVKVQYIDLRSRFKSDVTTIEFLLNIIGIVHKDFNFAWIFNDLKNALQQELDFVQEGKNGERCARDLQHFDYVYVPKVFWELTNTRVLVTEFIDGLKISDREGLKRNGFSLADINTKMFQAFGYQIFQTGFVHADPHPGNVLIRKYKGKTQLVLLDHGLYETVPEKDRLALSHMWKAIVLNNKEEMKRYSEILGVQDYGMFAEILTQMALRRHNFKLISKLTEEDMRHIHKVARERFDKVMAVLRCMPSSLLLVVRNLNTIRSIALEHGNPIDRYEVLARTATKRSFEKELGFIYKLCNIPTKMAFEIKLLSNKFSLWFQRTFLKILHFLGRSPDVQVLLDKIG